MKLFNCVFIAAIAGSIGCGSAANTNVVISEQNKMATNVNKVEITPTPEVVTASTGSLATPTDAYRTAYAIRDKKDAAAMKKILSKDVLEFLSMMAEGEKKTLDEEIATMFEKPQAKTVETRNEKISGNRATVEYRDETGSWDTMDFEKEGDQWKLSLPSRDDVKSESTTDKKPR